MLCIVSFQYIWGAKIAHNNIEILRENMKTIYTIIWVDISERYPFVAIDGSYRPPLHPYPRFRFVVLISTPILFDEIFLFSSFYISLIVQYLCFAYRLQIGLERHGLVSHQNWFFLTKVGFIFSFFTQKVNIISRINKPFYEYDTNWNFVWRVRTLN